MTAAWTLPASPDVSVIATARAVPLDTRPSYTLRAVPEREVRMVRAFVVYEAEPDPERYEQHAELCRKVPGATFRHGKVFAAPMGEPRYKYYAEWEFADRDAFKEAARTPEFMETGKDGMAMGIPFHVHFADVE
jgi:EthD domain